MKEFTKYLKQQNDELGIALGIHQIEVEQISESETVDVYVGLRTLTDSRIFVRSTDAKRLRCAIGALPQKDLVLV